VNCEQFKKRYVDFHDDLDSHRVLDWGFQLKTAALLEHLESCRGCESFAADYEAAYNRGAGTKRRKASELRSEAMKRIGLIPKREKKKP